MAKKKKTALKPNPNRGFATISVPSKKPVEAQPAPPAPAAAAADSPAASTNNDANGSATRTPGQASRGSKEAEEWDPESAEEMALQLVVDRVWDRADKEATRIWRTIEYDRRLAASLPIFLMDTPLRDSILAMAPAPALPPPTEQTFASLVPSLGPNAQPTAFLAKALTTHSLLLRLGFSSEQAGEALKHANGGVDVEDCTAWLWANLPEEEAEAARVRGVLGQRADQDETDDTRPPTHSGFTFERNVWRRPTKPVVETVETVSVLELSPGELAVRREQVRVQARAAFALAQELDDALDSSELEALEDPNAAFGKARAAIVALDRITALLKKATKSANFNDAPGALQAELREAERRLAAARTGVERSRDEAARGRYFDRQAGDVVFRSEMARREAVWKAREEEEAKLGKAHQDEEAEAASGTAEGQSALSETVSQEAVSSSNDAKEADAEAATSSVAPSDAGSDDLPMFGELLDEAPTSVTDDSGVVINVWPLPPAALKAGGGGKTPRSLLSEALRRVDPAANANFEHLSGQSVSRARLSLRWTPPGVTHTIVDTYTLTTLAAGSPSAAQELLAVIALTCVDRERHVERSLGKGWREWWDELETLRAGERDEKRRALVSRLGELLMPKLLEEQRKGEEREKRIKAAAVAGAASSGIVSVAPDGSASGTGMSTPVVVEQTEVAVPLSAPQLNPEEAEAVRNLWQKQSSSRSYKSMLPGRLNLPIANFKQQILDLVNNNQIFVLSGETGCGKSTQVPAYIVEACMAAGQPCRVYVTEPRRISAISLAERVSQEMGEGRGQVGRDDSLVGYGIRLESKIGKNARLVYATTGIVLRMLEGGRLEGITHIILDEVHERTIESDFLLIILKTLMEVRKDLKVILMSATLDAERISSYFDGCPTISVPGRTFPVDVRYLEDAVELCDYTIEDGSPYARRPKRNQWNQQKADAPGNRAKLASVEADDVPDIDDDDEQDGPASSGVAAGVKRYKPKTITTLDRLDESIIQHELICRLLERICLEDQKLQSYSAAVLIFMPGIADIRRLTDMLTAHPAFGSRDFLVFPLHSTISSEGQGSVFNIPPPGVRKIVIATNIAETGITIPDVTCVIDTGKHREMRFDEKRQMSRLVDCFVAKSNAKQRRGRAGRVQDGLCFHLFTKLRHDQYFADHPLPEMLRLSLQDLALKLKIMKIRIGTGIEDALNKAMDPPSSVNIQRAISALVEVKALTTSEEITPLGRRLAVLPLDVHMGKFLLTAALMKALDPALTIAATLNSKSPFISPFGREAEANRAKASFKAGDSDFVTYARAFAAWRRSIDNNFARQFCTKNFLSPQNLQQIEELRQQYLGYLIDSGFVQVDSQTKQDLARARFRSGGTRTPLQLLAELSSNSDSLAVLNAALCAGLYPKLLAIDARSYQLRTIGNNAPTSIHPSSVNFKTRLGELPRGFNHLVYFTIMQSRKLYAWETGAVDDRGLVLMCGDADFKITSSSLYIDRQRIRFAVPDPKTLLALRLLREQLSKLINASYRSPGKPWTAEQHEFFKVATQMLGMHANDKDRILQG